MSDGMKIFSGFALVLLIFLGFVFFIRGQFEEGSGLDLPFLAVPLKYEVNLEDSPSKYIVFVTLPALASRIIHQQPHWADEGQWSNVKTNMLFSPGSRLLRGTELTWNDEDIWFIHSSDQVSERNYLTRGHLVIVRTDNGFLYYLNYD